MTVGKHWPPSFGGLGDLEGTPGLREVFDDVEGLHADAADGEEVRIPEELMRRYVEQRLGGGGEVAWE